MTTPRCEHTWRDRTGALSRLLRLHGHTRFHVCMLRADHSPWPGHVCRCGERPPIPPSILSALDAA